MIDLHCHSVYSDGSDSVAEILEKANRLNLSWLSITDHNAVGACFDPSMLNYHSRFNGKAMQGVEITCMFEGEVVEVLGYGYRVDIFKEILEHNVLPFEEKQKAEYVLICDAFRRKGAAFDEKQIVYDPSKESCRKAFMREIAAHPENDRLFFDKNSKSISKSFTRNEIYNPESELYVDESSLYPSVANAVDMIHQAEGIAFLAHLYIYSNAQTMRKNLIDIVKDNRLDGVECQHSGFTSEQIKDLAMFCDSNHLLKSGGSDYHGTRKADVRLGIGKGQLATPSSYIEGWPRDILARHL